MAFNYGLAKQDGFSDEQIAQHLSQKQKFNLDLALTDGFNYSQIAQHLATQGEAEDTGFLREALDVPVLVGKGATQMVRMGTEAFGADNPVAQSLMGIEDYLGSLISAGSRNQQEEIAQIFEDAEGKGVKENVMAGLKALTVAPVDTLAQFGGSAIPFVAANVLTGGAASAPLALGATAGLGLTKGTIFDSVEQEYIQAGVDPETAKEIATEAQAYMGGKHRSDCFRGSFRCCGCKVWSRKRFNPISNWQCSKECSVAYGHESHSWWCSWRSQFLKLFKLVKNSLRVTLPEKDKALM